MEERSWSRFPLAALALAAAVVLATPAHAAGECTSLSGTVTGWIADGPQGVTWYGVAYLSFGREPHLVARFVDLNDGYRRLRFRADGSGVFSGYEILTFQVDGVGTFQVDAQFNAACSSLYACVLHETGKFVPEAGTGRFADMTGNLSIQGPFGGGDCGPDQPCLWIADVKGQACAP